MNQDKKKERIPVLPGILHEATSPDDESYLIGSRCNACGRTFFPKRNVCRVCKRDDTVEEIPLSNRGKLDTFTLIHVAPAGFEAPYLQAYVDLPEGVRLYTMVTGVEPTDDALKEGQEMELVITKIREDEKGNDLIGYKFRPVGSGSN